MTGQIKHPDGSIELEIRYRKMNSFYSDYTKNIAQGGTFIKTDRPLPPGTKFRFKLSLPRRTQPFELQGEVTWVNRRDEIQNEQVRELGMGIRFLFDDEQERLVFEEEVEDLMVASLGRKLYEKLLDRARSGEVV